MDKKPIVFNFLTNETILTKSKIWKLEFNRSETENSGRTLALYITVTFWRTDVSLTLPFPTSCTSFSHFKKEWCLMDTSVLSSVFRHALLQGVVMCWCPWTISNWSTFEAHFRTFSLYSTRHSRWEVIGSQLQRGRRILGSWIVNLVT